MSTVLDQIEQQIAKLSSKAVKKNTGNILTVADGVAKIEGLSDVMYNEMVQFPGGAIGIALNLEADEVGGGCCVPHAVRPSTTPRQSVRRRTCT